MKYGLMINIHSIQLSELSSSCVTLAFYTYTLAQ
jgi:hypothetical protein